MSGKPRGLRAAAAVLMVLTAVAPAAAQRKEPLPKDLEGVGITEHPGAKLPLDLEFTDDNGKVVRLAQYFSGNRPVILTLGYFRCPMLCTLVLNSLVEGLKGLPWTPGREFEIVTVSIDPTETFELAAHKKQSYLASYNRPAPGWHFLTDYQGNAKRLADQAGFHYRWDDKTGQYAHAAALTFLTPEGKVSRYLYGIHFRARDMRLALTEASQSKFGLSVDRLLLYCFHYDPQARAYVLFAGNVMRGGGVLTVLILAFLMWRMWRFEKRLAAAGVAAR